MVRTPGLDAAALEALPAAAVAAPSIHNTLPWRFRVDPDDRLLEVRAVRERQLSSADPDGRAQHLSVGAAVFNLRLAAERAHGEAVAQVADGADVQRPVIRAGSAT
ncbi:hypothetical protein ACWEO4_27810 [Streptomyces sp. NPDC004393]